MPDLEPALTVDRFDGLRLGVSPAQVGEGAAVDLLDVDWDARGVLGSRMGVSKFTAEDPAKNYDVIFGAGQDIAPLGESFSFLARRGEVLVEIDSAGEETGETLAVSTGRLNFTQMGIGTLTPITYIANQNETVKKYDGTTLSSPTATVDGVAGEAMPRGHFVANWQDGANRLVVANTTLEGGPAGASGSPAHVFFSEPGQPENYESTAYVQLNPGDGQQIIGMCAWGREIYVFKETYCFVFYGISADEEGRPIFNFRTVDLGTRATAQRGAGSPHVVAGREGVYFLAHDGVWVTSGGSPVRVTDALDFSDQRRDPRAELGEMSFPIWRQAKGLCIVGDSLYVGMPEEAGEGAIAVKRLFKIHLASGRVTYWKTSLLGFTGFALAPWAEGTDRLFCSGAGAKKGIYYYTPDVDSDALVEPNPYWLSGFYGLGDPDEKVVTQVKLWGSGDVDVAVAEDYGDPGKAKTFALGEGVGIAQAQHQRGQGATLLQHKLSGAAPWSVQRITRYLRNSRVSGTEKP